MDELSGAAVAPPTVSVNFKIRPLWGKGAGVSFHVFLPRASHFGPPTKPFRNHPPFVTTHVTGRTRAASHFEITQHF